MSASVGSEYTDPEGLLRSVVVAEAYRGQGYRTALCHDAGVRVDQLLVTSAGDARRGPSVSEGDQNRIEPMTTPSSNWSVTICTTHVIVILLVTLRSVRW